MVDSASSTVKEWASKSIVFDTRPNREAHQNTKVKPKLGVLGPGAVVISVNYNISNLNSGGVAKCLVLRWHVVILLYRRS